MSDFYTSGDCKYYPCHYEGQDCTFCYCPLYPCKDETLGKWVKGEVWDCSDCTIMHDKNLVKMLKIGIFNEVHKQQTIQLLKIRKRFKL